MDMEAALSDHGSGFRPGPFVVTLENEAYSASTDRSSNDYDLPHIIMTYTALISLSIIKDDFSRLDKLGLVKFLQSCQREDGSFSTVPQSTDSDLRTVYCAFAISSLLGDWSGIDVGRAVDYIRRCRVRELISNIMLELIPEHRHTKVATGSHHATRLKARVPANFLGNSRQLSSFDVQEGQLTLHWPLSTCSLKTV
jgi:hypothetical protein